MTFYYYLFSFFFICSSSYASYDVSAYGLSIIGQNSIAHEPSKSILLVGDKKLLLDFPLEVLHDMAVHNFLVYEISSIYSMSFVFSLGYFDSSLYFCPSLHHLSTFKEHYSGKRRLILS